MPEISVVIVSYNTRDLTLACLASLQRSDFGPLEIIVVDNASSDGSAQQIRERFPAVTVLQNRENAGFTRANNQGFRLAQGKRIWMLNPDTEVFPDSARLLAAALDREGGITAPTLLDGAGGIDDSQRTFPTLWWQFLHVTGIGKILSLFRDKKGAHRRDCTVDWAPGASLLFERELYLEIGGLDERFFMFCEEVDFCLRASLAGAKTRFIHEARVIHHEGKSCLSLAKPTYLQSKWSMYLYFRKHLGRGQALLYMVLACLEALTRAVRLFLVGRQSLRDTFQVIWGMCGMFLAQRPPLGAGELVTGTLEAGPTG